MTSTNNLIGDNGANREEEKKEIVNTILVIVTILVCFLCVFGVTKVKFLRDMKMMGMSMPYQNVYFIVVVASIIIGIIGLFNAAVMDMVGNQLRPILVFMSLTFTLLFTKFSSQKYFLAKIFV